MPAGIADVSVANIHDQAGRESAYIVARELPGLADVVVGDGRTVPVVAIRSVVLLADGYPEEQAILIAEVLVVAPDVVVVVERLGPVLRRVVAAAIGRTRGIGRRVILQDVERHRVDAARRDDVVREGLDGKTAVRRGMDGGRIIDLVLRPELQQGTEVAVVELRIRNRVRDRRDQFIVEPFISEREEAPVLAVVELRNHDRTVQAGSPAPVVEIAALLPS